MQYIMAESLHRKLAAILVKEERHSLQLAQKRLIRCQKYELYCYLLMYTQPVPRPICYELERNPQEAVSGRHEIRNFSHLYISHKPKFSCDKVANYLYWQTSIFVHVILQKPNPYVEGFLFQKIQLVICY